MKVLLVDDEPVARARIARLLLDLASEISDVQVVGEAGDSVTALKMIAEQQPDLLLLDIDIPGLKGIEIASLPNMPAIVFVTGSRDNALAAFSVGAHDYLLKPVQRERLLAALEKVRARIKTNASISPAVSDNEPWRLVVSDGSSKRFIDVRQVDVFEATEKYIRFHFSGTEILTRDSLDGLEERLASQGFLRLHRGALVRRQAIVAFESKDGGTCVLQSGERIPVSRRLLAEVREALGIA